jgi:hypothetical protein
MVGYARTFIGYPCLEERFDLGGAGYEDGSAGWTFALRYVECKVGVCVEGFGCRGAGIAHGC